MHFDVRAAKLLQPGEHLTVDDAPGLRLVASTAGASWVYRYKSPVDGRMRQVKLGAWPSMSLAKASAAWEALRAERAGGADPAVERRQARREAAVATASFDSVGGLLDGYLAGPAARRAAKGLAEMRRQFDALPAPVRALAPAQVTRKVAYDLVDSLARRAPVVAQQLRRNLGAAWDWAHDSGRLSEDVPNWWRLVLRGQLASRGKIVDGAHRGVAKRVLTPAEVGAVLRHLPHISQQMAELLTLYLWTGCRGAELVQMEGREVARERDGWWWTVPRAKLKMARHPLASDLRVPLVGRAKDIVLARRDVYGDGWLFPAVNRSARAHVSQKAVGVEVWTHMPGKSQRADRTLHPWPVVDWAPHDLRRTVRTQLAALGCPDEVAEAVLGHIAPGVQGVYNRHRYDAERRAWLTKLAKAWEQAAGR